MAGIPLPEDHHVQERGGCTAHHRLPPVAAPGPGTLPLGPAGQRPARPRDDPAADGAPLPLVPPPPRQRDGPRDAPAAHPEAAPRARGREGLTAPRRLPAARAYDGRVNEILSFAGNYWWLVFPLSGVFAVWGRQWSEAGERRHQRRMELYRLKHPGVLHGAHTSEQLPQQAPRLERDVLHVERMHDEVDRKWLSYELDAAKLIDYPTMTDVREPLTVAFLRAKREADGQRPATAADMTSPARLDAYRHAV